MGFGHSQDFFGSGHPLAHQPPAIVGQRAHAAAVGGFADFPAGAAFQNHLANLVGHIHPFENAAPAVVAGLAAVAAPDRVVNGRVGRKAELPFERLRGGGMILLLALWAKHPHEALGEHRFQRGRD